jgi:hypothetical protein
MPEQRLFLCVENLATGRVWRDRLDDRGAARALAIAQSTSRDTRKLYYVRTEERARQN